ncbi:MAG: glutamine amidotransferase [Pirellulaceae bacterium]
MARSILYLGDTALDNAAAYLAGLLHHYDLPADYAPSSQKADAALLDAERRCFILSDYPSAMLDPALQARLLAQVRQGAGLLMCGGWESFHGSGGDWDGTPIGDALPVEISSLDDRVNCDRPVLICRTVDHPTVADLPWDQRPPVIGGYNRVTPADGATVVLEAQSFDVRRDGDAFQFTPERRDPLLVVGALGQGRVAALMTDVAPHWVGPLVDWGPDRITAQAPGAGEIEVGCDYAQFLHQLVRWTAG